MSPERFALHHYDVLVVGAGGAGLRAAIEASARGARTGLVCKSLLGKAHTVMAESGIAAALGNVHSEDAWQAHFRDTMRGGASLNDWRMVRLLAEEAPERVLELETWGAVFDRTRGGLIRQQDAGGHRYARLAHVGDRTGLEMLRTLQQRAAQLGVDVHMECSVQRLLIHEGRISGAFALRRDIGEFVHFRCKALVLATGGGGRAWKVTSNSQEHTGDGMSLALQAGAELADMEFVQFHPTCMVWPASARGTLVTEAVRGAGGVLRNAEGRRFMFDYIPELLRAQTAASEAEADAWYADRRDMRRPPELLPPDVVARAIDAELRAGRGTPNGGVLLDIASRRSAQDIRSLLPSTCRRFAQLAGIDITRGPIEVAPACHYAMGGVRVDAETASSSVAGIYAAGEVAAGAHGASRLGGNSLADLLVFGRRAGLHAAQYALAMRSLRSDVADVERIARALLSPFGRPDGENPYALQRELQECMHECVGVLRTRFGLERALATIAGLKRRARNAVATGPRAYNPGWHLALDLESMLAFAQATALAALQREESRGAHLRSDFPAADAALAATRIVVRGSPKGLRVTREHLPEMPQELKKLMVPDELKQLLEEQYTWLRAKSTSGSGAATPVAESSRVTG
ncbi:MAG: fumarate reductase/succinate dehydrogenase flavoprotein subunit [Betaproteobacteria bacterium]|nr:fumarate reductase/succinate dehydrogenase flavoprotein subunit [Betaproteobacteria bacterium]